MNKKINVLRERLFNMEDFSHRTTEGKNKRFIYANKNLYTGANPQIRALEILNTLNEIKKDQIKGSKKNPKGSASGKSGGRF